MTVNPFENNERKHRITKRVMVTFENENVGTADIDTDGNVEVKLNRGALEAVFDGVAGFSIDFMTEE